MRSDWPGVLAALALGAASGALAWWALRPVLASEVLERRNFRDKRVPVGGGLALLLAGLVLGAAVSLIDGGLRDGLLIGSEGPVLVALLGFGLLGFIDDVVDRGRERGFRGHVAALVRGRVTSGGLKLVGGAAVALLAVRAGIAPSAPGLLRDAALVALAANLANLFDLAPGRVLKAASIGFVALMIAAGADGVLRPVAAVVGAGLALLWPDLRERVMLGDSGANPLGAVIGLGVVLTVSPSARLMTVVVLLILNLMSEVVSFSRVIDRVAPLRLLDGVGRMR